MQIKIRSFLDIEWNRQVVYSSFMLIPGFRTFQNKDFFKFVKLFVYFILQILKPWHFISWFNQNQNFINILIWLWTIWCTCNFKSCLTSFYVRVKQVLVKSIFIPTCLAFWISPVLIPGSLTKVTIKPEVHCPKVCCCCSNEIIHWWSMYSIYLKCQKIDFNS